MVLRGAGQTIGIFMGDGFAQSDIDGYAMQTGQSFLPVKVVPAKTPLTPGDEGTLDVEAALSSTRDWRLSGVCLNS
jgi:subtilase family serine protease